MCHMFYLCPRNCRVQTVHNPQICPRMLFSWDNARAISQPGRIPYTLTLWRRLLCFLASFRIPSVSVGEYDLCVAAVMGVAQQGLTFAADTHPCYKGIVLLISVKPYLHDK